MLYLEAEPLGSETLLDIKLEPQDEGLHKGLDDNPAIRTLRGRTNRILVGVPQTTNVLQRWPAGESLAPEIAEELDTWDFVLVRFACSFLPDRGCSFTWARLTIDLGVDETVANTAAGGPMAFDLFPREVIEKETYKRSFSLKPTLKFAFFEASASIGQDQDVIRYEPRLVSAGLLTETAAWTFSATPSPGLLGNKELFILVRKPKGSIGRASFKVAAEVQTSMGPVPLRKYTDEALVNRLFVFPC